MHIKIENLHKSFGENKVLAGVNLEIKTGELCIIIGASGTGKSILLKHIVGLIKPDSGRVLIDGEDIVAMNERKMLPLRKRFGMIFQNGGLLESLSLEENVGLALDELSSEQPSRIKELVGQKLEAVGLKGRESQMPATLSGGQRKRAAIARALSTQADCVLFDEPTAGLDPIMSDNIDQVILETNKSSGATIIVVTHDVASIFRLNGRIHMLHEGTIIESGSAEDFLASAHPQIKQFLARERREAGRVGF